MSQKLALDPNTPEGGNNPLTEAWWQQRAESLYHQCDANPSQTNSVNILRQALCTAYREGFKTGGAIGDEQGQGSNPTGNQARMAGSQAGNTNQSNQPNQYEATQQSSPFPGSMGQGNTSPETTQTKVRGAGGGSRDDG